MLINKISIIILENSKKDLQSLKAILQQFPEIMIAGEAGSGEKGLMLIAKHQPQIVFINLELPDINGFNLAALLQGKDYCPSIVFLADNGNLAFDALRYQPLDFFVKPIQKELIEKMFERQKTNTKKEILNKKLEKLTHNAEIESKRIFSYKNGIVVLHLDEIVYCKAVLAKSVIKLISGEELLLSSGITETIETINDNRFLRSNRSYWINRNYLRKIDKRRNKCILYNNGNSWEIPVSRTAKKMLESILTFTLS